MRSTWAWQRWPKRTHALYARLAARQGSAPTRDRWPQQRRTQKFGAKAVCFNRLGELRDRSFEAQRPRASGLNLVLAAIILWNTVYLERAIGALRQQGRQVDEGLLKSSMWRRPIGSTLTSPVIAPGGRTNASRRAVSGHSGSRPNLTLFPLSSNDPLTLECITN
jgi:hypothetical protein